MTTFLKCSKCHSDRGFLITTSDGKNLEIKGQLPVERILQTVMVACLYCNKRWEHGAEEAKWVTLGSYTVPEGESITIEEMVRRMRVQVIATRGFNSKTCTKCGKDFDTCPCPAFGRLNAGFADPNWPKDYECDQCGGKNIHEETCPIVIQRLRGM